MFGNISQILEMKKKAEEIKAKLESVVVTETHNGISIDCNGNKKILAIHIEPSLMNDKTKLEDNLIEAINKAVAAAERASVNDMAAMAGLFGK
jgi:DNA-binding protein YbaB